MIEKGYYNGEGIVKGDSHLVSENIKSGVTIFGVFGDPNVVDTRSGDAVAGELVSGKTAWVKGKEITGSLAAQSLVATSTTVAAGIYGATTLEAVDADLVSVNIKSGVTIFGVSGDANVVDTSSGDAVAEELVSGKKAWVKGKEITGSLPSQSLVATSTTVAAGIYAATTLEAIDSDLVSSNIKKDVSLFGVSGDVNVVDTSSGDATAGEILSGKKAWVAGEEVTGTRQLSPVPKTGQTISYETGDDGTHQTGVTTSPRFMDNGDGTVTDKLTGLIWLKKANCIGTDNPSFDTDGTSGDGKVYWQTALNFVTNLNVTPANCGVSQTDWRLPNRNELLSLVDLGRFSPALPLGHPFLNVQSDGYWSATTYAINTSSAWYVYLNGGDVGTSDKTVVTDYVWPVRGGQ